MNPFGIIATLYLPVAIVLLVLSGWLLLEVLLAFPTRSRRPARSPGPIAVVVPAHNEEAGIGATVRDLALQIRPDDRLVIVADNCTDRTAAIARAEGAEVIERHNPDLRGKGYALQFALDHLRAEPPASVLFTDADCLHSEGLVQAIAGEAEETGQPVQALYLMHASDTAPARRRVAAFSWLFMNEVRMKGLWHLARTTRLTGAGAAFPWSVAAQLDLGSGEIVEDLALSISLAERGTAVRLNTHHLVSSTFPDSDEAAAVQRARWEHGSLRMLATRSAGLIAAAFGRGGWRAFALGLDVAVPPLVIFGMILVANWLVSTVIALAGPDLAFHAASLALVAAASAVGLGWLRFGRRVLPAQQLGALVGFVLSKTGVYGKKARASSAEWTRTPREQKIEPPGGA